MASEAFSECLTFRLATQQAHARDVRKRTRVMGGVRFLNVKTRIAGVVSILGGLAAVVVGVLGFTMTKAMTDLPASQPFDAQQWAFHWKVSSLLIVAIGAALAVAGSALLKRKRWGFMVIVSAATVTALLPWVLSIVGFSQYAFEQPTVLESAVYIAIGIAALIGFRRFGAGSERT